MAMCLNPICVLSNKRYAGKVASLKKGTNHYILYGGPELAVEIRSRSNRCSEERKKRRNYFDNNTLEVWDVDYVKHKIWVYGINNPQTPQEYGIEDEIGCEPLLPGWRHKAADFFAPTLSAEQVVGQAAQEWRAESESKGREEGRQTGQLEALRSVLLLQAQARFGSELPSYLAERLARLGVEELTQLATSLATAPGLADWLAGWSA